MGLGSLIEGAIGTIQLAGKIVPIVMDTVHDIETSLTKYGITPDGKGKSKKELALGIVQAMLENIPDELKNKVGVKYISIVIDLVVVFFNTTGIFSKKKPPTDDPTKTITLAEK